MISSAVVLDVLTGPDSVISTATKPALRPGVAVAPNPPLPVAQPPDRVAGARAEFRPAPASSLAPRQPAHRLLPIESRHARHPAARRTATEEWASPNGYGSVGPVWSLPDARGI